MAGLLTGDPVRVCRAPLSLAPTSALHVGFARPNAGDVYLYDTRQTVVRIATWNRPYRPALGSSRLDARRTLTALGDVVSHEEQVSG